MLENFVTFDEFYDPDKNAAFQCGRLYIDSRELKLCVLVSDIDKHSELASISYLYLLYCKCVREKNPITGEAEQVIQIAAAVTAGDSDYLIAGRNGVFVDNKGKDWDATVVKIVSNPISILQAIFSPYKKIGAMIGEQINKFASSRQAALLSSANTQLNTIATAPAASTAQAAPAKFDISKNVGIFAAVGLALGVLGTALAGIAKALFALKWWQLPLIFVGIFVIISGASVVLAWLKLRKRTVGPLLEASGWAINSRVGVGYLLARTLTATAKLPDNSHKAAPVHQSPKYGLIAFFIALAFGALITFGLFYFKDTVKKDIINITEQNKGANNAQENATQSQQNK